MHPVNISNLSMSNMGFVVMLQSQQDERTLPIFIGVSEAQAIALHMNNVVPPRPMTHDLLKNIFDAMEGRLDHVEVYDLSEGTFYGRLVVTFEGRQITIDSRPSDAIALALRAEVPVFVADEVMEEAGVVMKDEDEEKQKQTSEQSEDPVQKLKEQLDQAVKDERYEEAAELRDEIKKRTSTN